MDDITIQRVSSEEFWDGYKEEVQKEFSDFLHCRTSVLYSDVEKEKLSHLKPEFKEEGHIFLFAKKGSDIVGRSFSEQVSKNELLMCMSYVKSDYRNRGIYTKLLSETISVAKEIGYMKVSSSHNTSNNKIIIPKLKQGFVVSGMKINAGYGTLVELTLFLNETEKDMQDFRCGHRKPTEKIKNILSI